MLSVKYMILQTVYQHTRLYAFSPFFVQCRLHSSSGHNLNYHSDLRSSNRLRHLKQPDLHSLIDLLFHVSGTPFSHVGRMACVAIGLYFTIMNSVMHLGARPAFKMVF